MALIQRVLPNNTTFFFRSLGRSLSTESSIKKSVFISQSKDIYANLALQDWICKNMDMADHHIMMLWQNEPCVTIARSHNPWCETNIGELAKIADSGVKMARQTTEGPSMYHDQGNLNITFFTKKERLCQSYDMEIVTRAIFREYSLKLDSVRDELKIRGNYTVSGTTKKVDDVNAYHHCSLLVGVNKIDRLRSLTKPEIGILRGNEEEFKESRIMNLCEENSKVNIPQLVKAIGWEFMRTHASAIKDGGNQLASQQKGFQMINPTDNWFPGIDKLRSDLTSWEWIYGKTPDFKVQRILCVPQGYQDAPVNLNMKITVAGGKIKDTTISMPPGMANSSICGVINTITTTLIGRKFSPELIENLQESIKNLGEDRMTSAYVPRKIMNSL